MFHPKLLYAIFLISIVFFKMGESASVHKRVSGTTKRKLRWKQLLVFQAKRDMSQTIIDTLLEFALDALEIFSNVQEFVAQLPVIGK